MRMVFIQSHENVTVDGTKVFVSLGKQIMELFGGLTHSVSIPTNIELPPDMQIIWRLSPGIAKFGGILHNVEVASGGMLSVTISSVSGQNIYAHTVLLEGYLVSIAMPKLINQKVLVSGVVMIPQAEPKKKPKRKK